MSDACPFPLHLSPAQLTAFCHQLRQRCGDAALALHALTTVQALLGLCIDDPQHPGYVQARRHLDAQLEELRTTLIAQHATLIGMALRRHDTDALLRGFQSLSRSGFAAAATQAWECLEPPQREDARNWLADWMQSARQRAHSAGRYPDAPDFRAAGIALDGYLMMEELHGIVLRLAAPAE